MDNVDSKYMRMAIALAEKGQGRTAPNPCVGAVIVKDDQVLGQGYHRRAGTPHAEVNAIADVNGSCAGATIYVTLEPCNHTGRTPPCSRAVLAAGIKRVVIGMADPNPVASGGAGFLGEKGIEVKLGVLEEECRQINYPFLKHSATGLPWVVMKGGMSLDGRISRICGQGGAITGAVSKQRVHELRNRLDAILIGIGTALIDNPSLTTRLEKDGRDPLRVVLDSRLQLPATATMLQQHSRAGTWVFCSSNASPERQEKLERAGAKVYRVGLDADGHLQLLRVLEQLGNAGITSVLVEGGSAVHGSFLRAGLVDQVYLFMAPFFIGAQGTPLVTALSQAGSENIAGQESLAGMTCEKMGQDVLVQGVFAGRLSFLSGQQ